jgi:hypothetical protein
MELFAISTENQNQSISIFIGETELSGVPSLELAQKFVSAAKAKGWDEELLLNTDSRRVSLVGSLLIDSLIEEVTASY